MLGLDTLNVLIAEDSRRMRMVLRSLLEGFGFRHICEARDGNAAFRHMCDKYVDLAFLNWSMGGLEGDQLTRLIRTHPAVMNPYCTIIMVSGHWRPQQVARAGNSGVNTFLAKPFSASTLRNHLRFVFDDMRPFIRHRFYVGPDRRWGKARPYGGLARRASDHEAARESLSAASSAISP